VRCALCAVRCALCAVRCALCAVCCVLALCVVLLMLSRRCVHEVCFVLCLYSCNTRIPSRNETQPCFLSQHTVSTHHAWFHLKRPCHSRRAPHFFTITADVSSCADATKKTTACRCFEQWGASQQPVCRTEAGSATRQSQTHGLASPAKKQRCHHHHHHHHCDLSRPTQACGSSLRKRGARRRRRKRESLCRHSQQSGHCVKRRSLTEMWRAPVARAQPGQIAFSFAVATRTWTIQRWWWW